MSRQVEHRKRRRQKGLCGREGCPVITGDASYYCPTHSKAHAARERARCQRWKLERQAQKAAAL